MGTDSRPTLLDLCKDCWEPHHRARRRGRIGLDDCPLIELAAAGTMPKQWQVREVNERGVPTYSCGDFIAKPPVSRRPKAPAQPDLELGLFDEPEPVSRRLVQVDGWRDYRAEQGGHDTE